MSTSDTFGWVGHTIDGKFAVEGVVGEGGFGVVYVATHLGFREKVAVKCLKVAAGQSPEKQSELQKSFTEEARLLHKLSKAHAGIVQALDVGAAVSPSGAWTPYIVMEWLEGQTLEQYLAQRTSPLGVAAAIELLTPAALAIAAAHAQGVAHRDIKPANLFLTSIAGAPTIKVLDFGIAKVVAESLSVSQALVQTGGNVRAFSPQYAAPEQFDPRLGATGPWTDVYAFALVLLEASSGRVAYSASDALQLFVLASDASRRPSFASCGVQTTAPLEMALKHAVVVEPWLRPGTLSVMWREITGASSLGHASTMLAADVRLGETAPTSSAAPVVARPGGSPAPRDMSVTSRGSANRRCTILVAEIEDHAALASEMDAEALREMDETCLAAVGACVKRFGGEVDKADGGRIVAVFGLAKAEENDAERAVTAALEVQRAITRVSVRKERRKIALSTRVALDTGWVFASASMTATRQEPSVSGEAVSAAIRLLARAKAGEVVVGRETYRHVEGRFEARPMLGPGERVESAYRIERRASALVTLSRTDFRGLPTKLVGRAAEVQRFEDALETVAAERRAQSVTMVALPGLGRSRLVAEALSSLSRDTRAFFVASARAAQLGRDTSYSLVATLLRGAFSLAEDDDGAALADKLRSGLRSAVAGTSSLLSRTGDAPSLASRAPTSLANVSLAESSALRSLPGTIDLALADLEESLGVVALALGARTEPDAAPSSASEHEWRQAKSRTSAAIARVLAFVLAHRPVAILCDDVQWADDASLDVLEDLCARLHDAPLFLLASTRSELFERRPHWGEGRDGHLRIELGPLHRRHIEEMARDRLRPVRALRGEVLAHLVDRAAGSPLVLSESLHLLIDAGAIDRVTDDEWTLAEDAVRALQLPGTIQGIMQARLDRLPADERDVLALASVIGDTFWESAIDVLLAADAATTDTSAQAARTGASLSSLRDKQVVRARERPSVPGEREYVFAERAMCEVVYQTLSRRRKRALHAAAAGWIAARPVGEAASGVLAYHFDRAELTKEAIGAYTRAGAHAASIGQNADAQRHYTRVNELCDAARALDDIEGEDRRVASWQERVGIELELATVMRRLGRVDEADGAYTRAREKVVRGERRAGSQSPGEVLLWEARIDAGEAATAKLRGDNGAARNAAERAIARVTEARAHAELPALYVLLSGIHRRAGDLTACRDAALLGLRVCRKAEERGSRWRSVVSELLIALGASFYARKRLIVAERCYLQASRLTDERSSPRALSFALNDVAAVRYERGDLPGARDLFLRSLALKEREGDLHQIAIALSNLAEVELKLGHASDALAHAESGVRFGEQAKAMSDLAEIVRNLAEALLATGNAESALVAAERALALALLPGAQVYLSQNARTLADVVAKLRWGAGATRAIESAKRALDALKSADVKDATALATSQGALEAAVA